MTKTLFRSTVKAENNREHIDHHPEREQHCRGGGQARRGGCGQDMDLEGHQVGNFTICNICKTIFSNPYSFLTQFWSPRLPEAEQLQRQSGDVHGAHRLQPLLRRQLGRGREEARHKNKTSSDRNQVSVWE